jgi:hypothetical protein
VRQVVECLPSKHDANLSTSKKRNSRWFLVKSDQKTDFPVFPYKEHMPFV